MSPQFKRFNRRFHFWAALVICLPVIIVIGSGLLLQVKKEVDWVQPPTIKGSKVDFSNQEQQETQGFLTLPDVLKVAKSLPQAEINSWSDVNKLDVRPDKNVVKVLAENNWEIQIELTTGNVLQLAFRRSDIIEAIHDGSFFHDAAKLWLFLPAAIALFLIWLSGIVMLTTSLKSKRKSKMNKQRQKM